MSDTFESGSGAQSPEHSYQEEFNAIVGAERAGLSPDINEVSDLLIALHAVSGKKVFFTPNQQVGTQSTELDTHIGYLKTLLPTVTSP